MSKKRILIVEDVSSLARTYAAYLQSMPHDVDVATNGAQALDMHQKTPFDVVVLDVNLPDMNGLEVMQKISAMKNAAEIIVITANGSVSLAVDAMRHGAFDFIVKPFNAERLRITVQNAMDRQKLKKTIKVLKADHLLDEAGGLVCESLAMQGVYRALKTAAQSNATVFITGESGTGKEVCAQTLHNLSKRAGKPFVALNCAAIPKDLLESELFGHAKGAFTGATSERDGAALNANGGTLFLDEICELDIALQAKLLRFLQTKTVQRLGEDKIRQCDVRFVCATNRDPMQEVQEGRFREDLYYRLFVIPVELAPLRERREDIMPLAETFLRQFAREDEKHFNGFSDDASELLQSYPWPGNVRQLQNVVRAAVVMNDGGEIEAGMLRLPSSGTAPRNVVQQPKREEALQQAWQPKRASDKVQPLEITVRNAIEFAVTQCGGSVPKAAELLEVSPSTLYRKIESWKLTDDQIA